MQFNFNSYFCSDIGRSRNSSENRRAQTRDRKTPNPSNELFAAATAGKHLQPEATPQERIWRTPVRVTSNVPSSPGRVLRQRRSGNRNFTPAGGFGGRL